ncbi:hypothetical protein MferCBS31731_006094 [Microsporum ferrugineum]
MEQHNLSPWAPPASPRNNSSSLLWAVPASVTENPHRATDDTALATQSIPDPSTHPRSCTFCRQRKVKCDRKKPCSYCIRSKAECTYPPGRGRAAKQQRNTLNAKVIDRLHSLEAIIKRLTVERDLTAPPGGTVPSQSCEELTPTSEWLTPDAGIEQQFGRLIVEDTRSHYISNVLWANLANEIEEMRDMLYDPASDDESCAQSQTSVSNFGSPLQPITTILGFPIPSEPMRTQHPPLFQSVALLGLFTENVLPLVHIFHMPTTSRLYWDAVESLDSLDKNTEALLFSIYYSAILSADPHKRESIVGVSSGVAVETYRFAVEQAIVRADLLNTRSILLLQAVVLFLSALRNEDDSRLVWSLIPLVLRIAQAMGLHRDGTIFGLKPLEIEVRRRLWYHICLLDIRSSEYHGYEPIVHEATFDTRLPLNVNDSDLNHQMTNPPPEREGQTEMTFCLIRCEVMRVGWKVGYAPPSLRVPGLVREGLSVTAREDLVEGLNKHLEDKYLRHCDTTQPFQRFYTIVARSIIARTWLVVLYPTTRKDNNTCTSSLSAAARNRLFSISMEVLELSNLLLTDKDLTRWTWHCKTYVQWHAVAFILSEICSRPPSTECERAWQCVSTVLDGWQAKKHDKNRSLWGPVRRLMAKARYVREMQQRDTLDSGQYAVTPTNPLSELPCERMQEVPLPLGQMPAMSPVTMEPMPGFRGTESLEVPSSYIGPTFEDLDIDSVAPWWVDASITM